MQEGAVLEMRGICKYFPGVRALQNVDFTLREGEIHALMGENGAGKSTLIKVLTGVYEKDNGEIFLKGKEGAVSIRSPQDAQNVGISTVYQEITLCPNLTVAENMFIARTKGAGVNWGAINRRAGEIFALAGHSGEPHPAAGQLLHRRAADGGHRPGGGHGVQGAYSRRAHLIPGRSGGTEALQADARPQEEGRGHHLRHPLPRAGL